MDISSQSKGTMTSIDGSRTITVEEFDRLFDEGSDEIAAFIDRSKGRMVYPKPQRVNVDFPPLMVRQLDAEAGRRGVTRQALIKMWLADKLDEQSRKAPRDAAE